MSNDSAAAPLHGFVRANDVIGSEPICDSCGGEGQVRLTDEGGNRMWWACPTCRPLEPVRLMDGPSATSNRDK